MSPDNPRDLSAMVSSACQQVMTDRSYIKQCGNRPNWDKSFRNKDFYQRVSEWMYNKERKYEQRVIEKWENEEMEAQQMRRKT